MQAYSAFHHYSLGNQILALVQCQLKGIQPGPINTYPKWKELERQFKKGEKALTLCMRITHKNVNRQTTLARSGRFVTPLLFFARIGLHWPRQTVRQWDCPACQHGTSMQLCKLWTFSESNLLTLTATAKATRSNDRSQLVRLHSYRIRPCSTRWPM